MTWLASGFPAGAIKRNKDSDAHEGGVSRPFASCTVIKGRTTATPRTFRRGTSSNPPGYLADWWLQARWLIGLSVSANDSEVSCFGGVGGMVALVALDKENVCSLWTGLSSTFSLSLSLAE